MVPGTDAPGYSHIVAAMTDAEFDEIRPDYVHITIDRNLAFDYAISYARSGLGPAALYRVKPLGHLEHDPDYPRGISHRCKSALVLALEPDVITGETGETGAALGYETWADGSPLYDTDGYPLPNQLQEHFGVKPSHLRSLGYHADFDMINKRCVETLRKLRPDLTQGDVLEYQRGLS